MSKVYIIIYEYEIYEIIINKFHSLLAMNVDKLRRLQAQVRIGGKGTPRRKKKVVHQSAATDDKKLQSSLKKLSVSTIPGIEEVNIIKDDLTVIHFNNPKAQASLSANTFAVTGHGETKKVVELLPEILPQLGQDTVTQLRMFASNISGGQKFSSSRLSKLTEENEELGDDDVPLLVSDFEEVAKKADEALKLITDKQKEDTVKVVEYTDEEKKNSVELPIAKTAEAIEQLTSATATTVDDAKSVSKEDKIKNKKSIKLTSENTAKNKIVSDIKLEKSEAKSLLTEKVSEKLEKKTILPDKHVSFKEKSEQKEDDNVKNNNKLSLSSEVTLKQSQQSKKQDSPSNQQNKSKQQQQKQELLLKKEQQSEKICMQQNLDAPLNHAKQQLQQNQQQKEELKSLQKSDQPKLQQMLKEQNSKTKQELQGVEEEKPKQQKVKPVQQTEELTQKLQQPLQQKLQQPQKDQEKISKETILKEKAVKVKNQEDQSAACKDQEKKIQEKVTSAITDDTNIASNVDTKQSTKLTEEGSVPLSKGVLIDLKVQAAKDSSVVITGKEMESNKVIEPITSKTTEQTLNSEMKHEVKIDHEVTSKSPEEKKKESSQFETVEKSNLLPLEKKTNAGERNQKDNTKSKLDFTINEGKQSSN